MGIFSIKDLEHLSGIKAHTIRVWEQRYQLINPKRTETNIRYYDDLDLKLILNIALLKENGIKISKIAELSESELQNEVLLLSENTQHLPEQIHALTIAMVDLDEDRFEKLISTNILKEGFEKTMLNIIHPFLSRIGILWQTGAVTPAQEHFITNLVRQKLIAAIDAQHCSSLGKARKYILFLPEGELHELSLLFADFIIRSRKNKAIYLGQSLPIADVKAVNERHHADYILTILTTVPGPSETQNYVNRLAHEFPNAQVLLTGYQVVGQDIDTPENVTIFHQLNQFIRYVEEKSLNTL